MARSLNILTAVEAKNEQPGDEVRRLKDGGGMRLIIEKSTDGGRKWWRFDYRFTGKQKTLSLGVYPDVSLKEARERRDDARKKLEQGIDPSVQRQIQRASLAEDSFEAVAREWHSRQQGKWTKGYSDNTLSRMEQNLFPWLGKRNINDIKPPELLACLRRIESRGATDMAHRCKQVAGLIFRYAVAIGKAERDPSQDLRGALTARRPEHYASITNPKQIGELLRAIEGYTGDNTTRLAFQLAPLVFVRPGELRRAEWAEFDMEAKEWRIPAEKMKMKAPHIVPLAPQALAILEELRPLTGHGKYLFSSLRTLDRPMSENTINAALRRLGYDQATMTGHGFRSMASTRLNEMGWNRDAIERQLAHAERDSVRAAYNYAEHLPERRRMMAAWADYLDGLRKGADVVALKRVQHG